MSRNEVEHLLKKNWSDKTFDAILKCTQGDLKACKKINLEKWKQTTEKDVDKLAKSAKKRSDKETYEKKKEALEKINKLVKEKTGARNKVDRRAQQELKILQETQKLRDQINANDELKGLQKRDTLAALNNQSKQMIDRLYGRQTDVADEESGLSRLAKIDIKDNNVVLDGG